MNKYIKLTEDDSPTIAELAIQHTKFWQVRTKFANLPKAIYHEITLLMRSRSLTMSTKTTFFHNASTGTLTAYCNEVDAKALQMALQLMGLKATLAPFTCRKKGA